VLGKTRFNHFGLLAVIFLAPAVAWCAVHGDFFEIWSLITTQPIAEPESGLLLAIGLIGLRRFLAGQWKAEKKNIAS
jgi:hypothetical protein